MHQSEDPCLSIRELNRFLQDTLILVLETNQSVSTTAYIVSKISFAPTAWVGRIIAIRSYRSHQRNGFKRKMARADVDEGGVMGTFVAIRIVGQLGVMAEKSQFRWMDGVLCFQSDGFRQEREICLLCLFLSKMAHTEKDIHK